MRPCVHIQYLSMYFTFMDAPKRIIQLLIPSLSRAYHLCPYVFVLSDGRSIWNSDIFLQISHHSFFSMNPKYTLNSSKHSKSLFYLPQISDFMVIVKLMIQDRLFGESGRTSRKILFQDHDLCANNSLKLLACLFFWVIAHRQGRGLHAGVTYGWRPPPKIGI